MAEKHNPVYEKKKKRSFRIKLFTVIASVVLVISAIVIFGFHLTKVNYVGNKYYTNEELEEKLLSEGLSGNSLYVLIKYNLFYKTDLPFVQSIKVRMLSPSHIEFEVIEKVTVGCVDYMGTYMYFDNEGYVVESSGTLNEGIPVIAGLSFDHLVVNEKLPVQDDKIFNTILTITQYLMKNKLVPDKVFFGAENDITLHFGLVKVALGKDENLKLKITDAASILPSLKDQCGTLHMENYSSEKNSVTFQKEDPPQEPENSEESNNEDSSEDANSGEEGGTEGQDSSDEAAASSSEQGEE